MRRTTGLLLLITLIISIGPLVLFWLFLFGYSFTLIELELTLAKKLIWDTLLCLIFFIQHSVMIRRSFRSKLSRIVSGKYHGILYSLSSGITLFILVTLWQSTDPSLLRVDAIIRWLMHGVFFMASFGMVWSVRVFESFDMLGIRSAVKGADNKREKMNQLIVKGPYGIVRHPLYSLVLILIWIRPDISYEKLLFNLLFTGWIIIGTFLEERDMVNEFGDTYRRYQGEVSMLLPWKKRI